MTKLIDPATLPARKRAGFWRFFERYQSRWTSITETGGRYFPLLEEQANALMNRALVLYCNEGERRAASYLVGNLKRLRYRYLYGRRDEKNADKVSNKAHNERQVTRLPVAGAVCPDYLEGRTNPLGTKRERVNGARAASAELTRLALSSTGRHGNSDTMTAAVRVVRGADERKVAAEYGITRHKVRRVADAARRMAASVARRAMDDTP